MGASSNKVDFTPSDFTTREIRYELPALLTDPSVKVLHLPINRLDDACIKCLVMILERDDVGPQVEELHLAHTQSDPNNNRSKYEQDEAPFMQIVSSLPHSRRLKKLAISEAALNACEISAVASMLYDVTSLRTLALRQCGIDHKGATKLFCALASNKSVDVCDFSNNHFGNRGASALGVALEINTSLKKLKLSGTRMGIEGAAAIATAITGNSTLEILDVSRNPMGDMGVSKLAISLKSNKSVRQLSLRQTSMSDVGVLCILLSLYDPKNLQAILHCNHSIHYLNLNNNEVRRKCLLDIEIAIRMNLLRTEKETIRQKVASFLKNEANTSCFGASMTIKCMPYLISSIGNTEHVTPLFHLLKNVNMPALFKLKQCSMSAGSNSLFSNESNATDHADKNVTNPVYEVGVPHELDALTK